MIIRQASNSDLNDVLNVERQAFGQDDEAQLVQDLLNDPTAKPTLSLLAFKEDQPVGHILFTAARLSESSHYPSISILAPLAIVPHAQKQGIGGRLIEKGLHLLSELAVDLVFVLGHPSYYPRYGFKPALPLGLEAPYPIPNEHADAWMVHPLRPNIIGAVQGKVICSDTLSKPELWRE